MHRHRRFVVLAAGLAVVLVTSCRWARPEHPLTVLAAASLTDALPAVAEAWRRQGGAPVRFSFDATSRLASQISEGAPADLFVSADAEWMDHVAKAGCIDPATRRDLVGNELVLIAPASAPLELSTADDLALSTVSHIALAGEHVPAGRYAQAALDSLGIWPAVRDRVVRAGSVRAALEWVARNEADAGVVYRTDAQADPRVRIVWAFPEDSHPPIVYAAAVLATSAAPAEAARFLEFCQGDAARRVFAAAGFRTPAHGTAPDSSAVPRVSGPSPWSAIALSVQVGLWCALLGFLPAMGLGRVLARRDFAGKTLVSTVLLAPLVLPPVVTGFLLLQLVGANGPLGGVLVLAGVSVPFTFAAAVLAAFVMGLPLYVLAARTAFEVVDPRYEEVSWTLGVPPRRTHWRVTLPLALPGIAAGAVMAFARALGEFGATVVLAGNVEGRTRTIALAVYTLLESPQGDRATRILVCASIGLSMAALLGYEVLLRWQRRRLEQWDGR